MTKVKVLRIFRDKFTKEVYSVGKEIQFSDDANVRVQDLISRRLVEVVVEESKDNVLISLFDKEFDKKTVVESLKATGVKATMNMKAETLVANVSALNGDNLITFKKSVGI